MAKRKADINKINGLFIYHEKNLGTIWYDIFTKKGYIMVNSDFKQYALYTMVLPAAILVALMLYIIAKAGLVLSIVTFLVISIIGEVYFRFAFFYKLPVAKNWDKPSKQNITTKFSKKYSSSRLTLLMILLYTIFVLSIGDIFVEKVTAPGIYLNIIMGVVSIIFAIIVTIAKIKQK